MRVGMFADAYTPDINGVVSSIVTLQRALEQLGHEVFVVTTLPKSLSEEQIKQEEEDGHILRFPGLELKSLYGYVLTSPYHFKALETIEKWHLDVIHVHTEFSVGIFARIVSNKLSIPLVSTYHTMYEDYTHYVNIFNSKMVEKAAKKATYSLSKLYGDKCTALIVPSAKTKERLEFYGVKKKIHVIPTGLDLQKFKPSCTDAKRKAEIRKETGVPDDAFMIVYVGRVAEEKSIDMIIDAFTYVKAADADIRLVIVGGGPQLDDLRKQAERLQLNDVITFTDKRPHTDVPAYYHSADAFVSASLSETQGMTFIEALASGLAVFARPDDVLDGLVVEGQTGFLFQTPQEFAEKLVAFAKLPQAQRAAFANQAIEQVKCYDSLEFGRRVLDVYEHAIEVFRRNYVIHKIKMKEDLVELTLSGKTEETKIMVTLDRYLEGKYHKDMMLHQDDVESLLKHQEYALAYYGCIRKIASKDRTRKEIYDYLTGETELDIKTINELVEKLEEKGYINDYRYMVNQIESMHALKVGHDKIIRTLVKKGIPQAGIEEILDAEDKEQEIQRGLKWAEKMQGRMVDKSLKMKKSLLRQKLFQQGYQAEIADEIICRMSFSADEEKEIRTLQKLALKAKQRYQTKYQGSALRNTVFRFLITKGFQYDDIYQVLNEMEWDDDHD